MKKLITITLLAAAFNSQAFVKLSDAMPKSGAQSTFKTIEDVKASEKPVCIYVNRKYVPVNEQALKAAGGKTCRIIGKVGVDYEGINSSSRNSHLYAEVLKAMN